MLTWILVILSLLGAIALTAFVSLFWQLYRAEISVGTTEVLEEEDLADLEKKVLRWSGARLLTLGFNFSHFAKRTEVIGLDRKTKLIAIFNHRNPKIWAEATPSLNLNAKRFYDIDFITYCRNGEVIVSSQSPASHTHCEPACYLLAETSGLPIEERFRFHIDLVEEKEAVEGMSPVALSVRHSLVQYAQLEEMIKVGWVKIGKNDKAKMKFVACLTFLRERVLVLVDRIMERRRPDLDTHNVGTQARTGIESVDPFEHDVFLYEYGRVGRRSSWAPTVSIRLGWALAALGLWYSLSGFSVTGFSVACAVSLVLLHDLSQLIAMLLLRYKWADVLFVPLLAEVLPKFKRSLAPVWKKNIVLASGPIVSVLLGAVLWLSHLLSGDLTSSVEEISSLAVGFGLLCLLPFSVLNGGWIAEITWYSHFPHLRYWMTLAVAASLSSVGLALDLKWLSLLPLGLTFIVKQQSMRARLIQRVRSTLSDVSIGNGTESLAGKVFREIHRTPYSSSPMSRRCSVARSVINEVRRPFGDKLSSIVAIGLLASGMAIVSVSIFYGQKASADFASEYRARVGESLFRYEEKEISKTRKSATVASLRAIDEWFDAEYSGEEVVRQFASIVQSSDRVELLDSVDALVPYYSESSYKKVLRSIDLGLGQGFDIGLLSGKEGGSEEQQSYLSSLSKILALDALKYSNSQNIAPAYSRLVDMMTLSSQFAGSVDAKHSYIAIDAVNDAIDALEVVTKVGIPKESAQYSSILRSLREADRALNESFRSYVASVLRNREEHVFGIVEFDDESYEGLKEDLGVWNAYDLALALYLKSPVVDVDRGYFYSYISDISTQSTKLPFARQLPDRLDETVLTKSGFGPIVSTGSYKLIGNYLDKVDLARARIRMTGVAMLLYLGKAKTGELPDSLDGFANVKTYGDWTADLKTGRSLFYEKTENGFVLRSEIPRFKSKFSNDDWDNRLYWSGAYGKNAGEVDVELSYASRY